MYEKGLGIGQDYSKAGSLYRKACKAGNLPACSNLGVLYANGRGVRYNVAKAVSLSYVDAAHACVRLALHEVSPPVDTSGNLNKPRPKADVKRVEMLMALGERAVKIAKDLDVLGDKALVRVEPQTQTQTQIQEQ